MVVFFLFSFCSAKCSAMHQMAIWHQANDCVLPVLRIFHTNKQPNLALNHDMYEKAGRHSISRISCHETLSAVSVRHQTVLASCWHLCVQVNAVCGSGREQQWAGGAGAQADAAGPGVAGAAAALAGAPPLSGSGHRPPGHPGPACRPLPCLHCRPPPPLPPRSASRLAILNLSFEDYFSGNENDI